MSTYKTVKINSLLFYIIYKLHNVLIKKGSNNTEELKVYEVKKDS